MLKIAFGYSVTVHRLCFSSYLVRLTWYWSPRSNVCKML